MRRLPRFAVLKRRRTERAKVTRRMCGDNSGMCRFADKELFASDALCSNTVTSCVDKDCLILVEYGLLEHYYNSGAFAFLKLAQTRSCCIEHRGVFPYVADTGKYKTSKSAD